MNEITWFDGLLAFAAMALACHGVYRAWIREAHNDDER
jgi:hypothetical protein